MTNFIEINCRKTNNKHYISINSITQIYTLDDDVFIDLVNNIKLYPIESKDIILHMINLSSNSDIIDKNDIQSMYEQHLMWEQTATSFYNNNQEDELPF